MVDEFNSPYSFGDKCSPHRDDTVTTAKIARHEDLNFAKVNQDSKEKFVIKSHLREGMKTIELATYNEDG